MDPILRHIRRQREAYIALLASLVEVESPSGDAAAVGRFVELVSDTVAPLGRVRKHPGGTFGPHLTCEVHLPGRRKNGQVLVLGHSDTVWPLGTLPRMPFRRSRSRLSGPGVLDMKAGIASFVFAVRALAELEIPVSSRILLQLNSDEEVGSPTSRALTESNARASRAVLVLEPGTGLSGQLKTARKGVGVFTVVVHGKAAHAGVDFSVGASAILELARQIERIAGFTNLARGITVNPGVIAGGTRSNVIAESARAEVDVRVPRLGDAASLERKFHRLAAFDKRCRIELGGGLNRPPMERTPGTVRLFRLAQKLGSELGVRVEESHTGGGSDGNFTAALGVPTLDGLGAAGEGAHAANESVLINRIADRTALLAKLLAGV
ncbi:MAG: M20 family metallopeptidase [Bryobacteraceae bacterium]